jgi:hypothetical protein
MTRLEELKAREAELNSELAENRAEQRQIAIDLYCQTHGIGMGSILLMSNGTIGQICKFDASASGVSWPIVVLAKKDGSFGSAERNAYNIREAVVLDNPAPAEIARILGEGKKP